MLQEEEKLRYADETPVESRRQKWLKRGTKHDHRNSCGGSSRPMTTKSKKGVGPR
uniref:Uncharacterized protein n=1 Tax=Plectus sambesii TaxID=2011161 RepID=A0A914VR41_9BILA